jgi:dolichol-phosphate mannosyltransferase
MSASPLQSSQNDSQSVNSQACPVLSVVIATLNEAGNIALIVARLDAALTGLAWEAVFVDDDSPDGTASIIRSLAGSDPRIRLVHRIGRRGLASACIEGMKAAQAPVIAVIDADLQHDETLLPVMFKQLRDQDLDLVIGSRYVAGGGVGDFSPMRRMISRMGQLASLLVIRERVQDLMSGFFMLKRDFFYEVAPDLSGIGYKILLDILSSSRRPLKLAECPFNFGARQHGQSKLNFPVMLDHARLIAVKFARRLVR